MPKQEFSRKAEQLQIFFGAMAEEIGQRSGFVQRQSKMTAMGFVQTLVLGWLSNPTAALSELIQVSAEMGISISEAGLHQRMNDRAVTFLQALFQQGLSYFRENSRLPASLFSPFSQVNLVDSSLYELPADLRAIFPGVRVQGYQAALKTHLSFDYLSGNLNAVEVSDGHQPDQTSQLPEAWASPNSLTVFDLGFFKKQRFAELEQAGGFFISRLQTQTALYGQADEGATLDLLAVLQQQAAAEGELMVSMKAKRWLSLRLIYSRLPEAVAEQRRRKARANARRRGETCSQRHLDLLGWTLFVTNVPTEWLSAEAVRLVYRLRWQIELLFKLWKSQAKLDRLGDWRLERLLCQFYGRLLGLLVFHWLVARQRCWPSGELSLPKAFRLLQRHALRLLAALLISHQAVNRLLAKLSQDFRRFARQTKRRKSPSTYQRLLNLGGLT